MEIKATIMEESSWSELWPYRIKIGENRLIGNFVAINPNSKFSLLDQSGDQDIRVFGS